MNETHTGSSLNTPLDYAQAPRFSRRRITRWIVIATLLAFAAWPVLHWGQPWCAQCRYLYYQRRCLNFTRGANSLMYDEGTFVYPYFVGLAKSNGESWFHLVQHFSKSQFIQGRIFWSQDLNEVYGNSTAVFLHGRTSLKGNLRLVNISTHPGFYNGDQQRDVNFNYSVFTLADWKLGSKVTQASFIPPLITIQITDRWQVYAGQIDPLDATHFTIDYAINGQRGTVEGWLTDRDSLRFHIRSGPATTRPTKYFK